MKSAFHILLLALLLLCLAATGCAHRDVTPTPLNATNAPSANTQTNLVSTHHSLRQPNSVQTDIGTGNVASLSPRERAGVRGKATPMSKSSETNNSNTITVGMDYDKTISLIKKHSGTDITSGLALMPLDRKSPLTARYWRFQDYDAVLGLFAQDKVITGMTYWTKADFSHSKAHRAQTEQTITALKFNPATKEVSIDKTIVPPLNSSPTRRLFTRSTNPITTNTLSPEFIAQNENAFERMMEETARCLELANQADVMITYGGHSGVHIRKPGDKKLVTVTEKTMLASVVNMTFKRDLVVVDIIGPWGYTISDKKLRDKVDELEALFRAQGFQRVVFHRNTATGIFTIRE